MKKCQLKTFYWFVGLSSYINFTHILSLLKSLTILLRLLQKLFSRLISWAYFHINCLTINKLFLSQRNGNLTVFWKRSLSHFFPKFPSAYCIASDFCIDGGKQMSSRNRKTIKTFYTIPYSYDWGDKQNKFKERTKSVTCYFHFLSIYDWVYNQL